MDTENIVEKWLETIPEDVLQKIEAKLAREASFGAGPGFVAGQIKKFDPEVSLRDALAWLNRYRSVLRRAHVRFDDKTVLWFERSGFWRYDDEQQPAPEPGITVRHKPEVEGD